MQRRDKPAPGCDEVRYGFCGVNCGNRCALVFHMKDGMVHHVETDSRADEGDCGLQARACLKGRAIKQLIYDHDARLKTPLKRVGRRGEGDFAPISWDEALDTVASEIERVRKRWGNEALYLAYGAGIYSATAKPFRRLLNCLGGSLGYYGSYSDGQLRFTTPFMFGTDDMMIASTSDQMLSSDLIMMFGYNPAETFMGGAGDVALLADIRNRGIKVYQIDPRLNESVAPLGAQWVPIRPGTDAALASAIAHELVAGGAVDEGFLAEYCIGYDGGCMPQGADPSLSYKSYLMGTGYDGREKTPEWAQGICGVPAGTIRRMAADLACAKRPFIVQNYGVQRQSNGEMSSLAIAALSLLTGKVGLEGTNIGCRLGLLGSVVGEIPAHDNPVATRISYFSWPYAIADPGSLTSRGGGVQGADGLKCGIKLLVNYAGNTLTNQHGDIRWLDEVLSDESACEFICCIDVYMTDSARYADILLPDMTRFEQESMTGNGSTEARRTVLYGDKVADAPFCGMSSYDMCCEIAKRLGCLEAFSEGLAQGEWNERLYEQARLSHPDEGLPAYDELKRQGFWKGGRVSRIALEDFRASPKAHPLPTPSGKIELYSQRLADIASSWAFDADDVITPVPTYVPAREGYERLSDEFPLIVTGFHDKRQVHSTFAREFALDGLCPMRLWINPVDAKARAIADGDACVVESPRGAIRMRAFVTKRVMPGVVCVPQGSWRAPRGGDASPDEGGCINVLTSARPSPLAKGNAVHTFIGQVRKDAGGEQR